MRYFYNKTIERFYKVLLEMISEKNNDEKLFSFSKNVRELSSLIFLVFHIKQKIEFEKFNWFFVNFLRYRFGRIKVISTVVEREYTPGITRQICFADQLTGFYMKRGFTERYFLTGYSYVFENHFYFVYTPGYCFKHSLSRIFCLNSSVKVLSLKLF